MYQVIHHLHFLLIQHDFFHNLCLVDTKDVKNVPKIGILFAFISLTTFTVPTKHLLSDCFEGHFICFLFIHLYVTVTEGHHIWEVFISV